MVMSELSPKKYIYLLLIRFAKYILEEKHRT